MKLIRGFSVDNIAVLIVYYLFETAVVVIMLPLTFSLPSLKDPVFCNLPLFDQYFFQLPLSLPFYRNLSSLVFQSQNTLSTYELVYRPGSNLFSIIRHSRENTSLALILPSIYLALCLIFPVSK